MSIEWPLVPPQIPRHSFTLPATGRLTDAAAIVSDAQWARIRGEDFASSSVGGRVVNEYQKTIDLPVVQCLVHPDGIGSPLATGPHESEAEPASAAAGRCAGPRIVH